MLIVSLNDLKFHANHGLYEEERILGNQFIVNCLVKLDDPEGNILQSLDETVNYQVLFELIKEYMQHSESLLETLCMKMGKQILKRFPCVKYVFVSVTKNNPPINGFTGSSSVSWQNEN